MLNNFQAPGAAHICLGVCTFQRPYLLMQCLQSLRGMDVPDLARLTIVVIDNEPTPQAHELVQSFVVAGSSVPILYVHEPRRGIAQARNAVLDKADEIGAGWIAMIDDDQTVPADWLVRMWQSRPPRHGEQADVVKSNVRYEMPDPLPAWAPGKQKSSGWKLDMLTTATNGVLFRAGLLDRNRAPLRFDEGFALTGGEDSDFFARAHQGGAYIVLTPDAVIFEHLPASRLTLSAQLGRCYWQSYGDTRRDVTYHGFIAAMAVKSTKFTKSLFKGLTALALAPFVALVSRQSARRKVLRGCKAIATAAGISSGLLGLARPEPYRTIHGN